VIVWSVFLFLLFCKQVGVLEGFPLKLLPGDNRVWLAVTGLAGLGFWRWTSDVLRRGEYMRRYLSSCPEGPYRSIVRAQLLDLLLRLKPTYERLLLVAHSHGTVIALDLLGIVPPSECPRLHVVTIGSPIISAWFWGEWIDDALKLALTHSRVAAWTDLHSRTDMLCGPVPHPDRFHLRASVKPSVEVKFMPKPPWILRMSGQTHDRYLDDEETAKQILKAAEALAGEDEEMGSRINAVAITC